MGAVPGEASVVPWHPHVGMPEMTACYRKSEALLGSWALMFRPSGQAWWGPTCLEKR